AGPLRGPLGPGTRPAGRALVLSAALVASMRAAAGLVIALVIFGFRRESAPLIWYGLVGVASVGGHLGGAILAPAIRRRFGETRTVSGAAMAIGLVALGVTQVDSMGRRPAALVLATVIGLAASVAKLAFDAVVQRDAPSASRSRVFARLEATFQLVWVLGALVPVLIPMPLLVGFVLVATLTLAASAGYFAAMVGKRRHERPRWAPDATA
ncbi:MAG: hypothetical protein ACR2NJ_03490, partial [Acidimicrobiales bacterium]